MAESGIRNGWATGEMPVIFSPDKRTITVVTIAALAKRFELARQQTVESSTAASNTASAAGAGSGSVYGYVWSPFGWDPILSVRTRVVSAEELGLGQMLSPPSSSAEMIELRAQLALNGQGMRAKEKQQLYDRLGVAADAHRRAVELLAQPKTEVVSIANRLNVLWTTTDSALLAADVDLPPECTVAGTYQQPELSRPHPTHSYVALYQWMLHERTDADSQSSVPLPAAAAAGTASDPAASAIDELPRPLRQLILSYAIPIVVPNAELTDHPLAHNGLFTLPSNPFHVVSEWPAPTAIDLERAVQYPPPPPLKPIAAASAPTSAGAASAVADSKSAPASTSAAATADARGLLRRRFPSTLFGSEYSKCARAETDGLWDREASMRYTPEAKAAKGAGKSEADKANDERLQRHRLVPGACTIDPAVNYGSLSQYYEYFLKAPAAKPKSSGADAATAAYKPAPTASEYWSSHYGLVPVQDAKRRDTELDFAACGDNPNSGAPTVFRLCVHCHELFQAGKLPRLSTEARADYIAIETAAEQNRREKDRPIRPADAKPAADSKNEKSGDAAAASADGKSKAAAAANAAKAAATATIDAAGGDVLVLLQGDDFGMSEVTHAVLHRRADYAFRGVSEFNDGDPLNFRWKRPAVVESDARTDDTVEPAPHPWSNTRGIADWSASQHWFTSRWFGTLSRYGGGPGCEALIKLHSYTEVLTALMLADRVVPSLTYLSFFVSNYFAAWISGDGNLEVFRNSAEIPQSDTTRMEREWWYRTTECKRADAFRVLRWPRNGRSLAPAGDADVKAAPAPAARGRPPKGKTVPATAAAAPAAESDEPKPIIRDAVMLITDLEGRYLMSRGKWKPPDDGPAGMTARDWRSLESSRELALAKYAAFDPDPNAFDGRFADRPTQYLTAPLSVYSITTTRGLWCAGVGRLVCVGLHS